ncbi:hypothetical protein FOZ62_014783, partial [Perkinsus olseni]
DSSVSGYHDLICANINVVEGRLRPNASSTSIKVRVCCDSGSQLNLVTSGFVEHRGLLTQSIRPTSFSGIGGEVHKFTRTAEVLVTLGNGFYVVKCGVVPKLPSQSDLLLNHETAKQLSTVPPEGAVDWDKLDEVIEGTLSAEWTRVPSAEGFLMRLRKLDDKEARDHPDQKYCCEMAVDSSCAPGVAFTDDKTASPSVYDYGYDIYRKLPEVQRQQYDQAVNQFCEDGHWEEVDESEVRKEPGIPTVICFPVTSSTSSTVEGDVYDR